ncbi:SPTY2D1 (predicted), partial [Pycnogonum litorale]
IEQKNRDSMLTQKKRRKRRHVDADGKEYMDYSELKIYDSKEMRKKHRQDILYEKIKREIEVLEKTKTRPKVAEKKQARRPPPPSSSTMDFDKLMRLANKLQHRPVEVKQVETESTEERPKSKKEKIDRQTEKAHRSSGDKKQSVVKDVKKSTANPDRDKIREVPNHGAPKSNVGVAKVKSDTVLPVSGKSSAGEHKSCRRYKIHSSIHDRTINDKKSVTPYQTSKTISDKKPPPVYRMSKTLSDKKPVPAYQMSKTPSDKKPVPAYQMSKTLSDKKPVPAYQTSRKSLDVPQYTTSLSKSEKRLPSYSTGDKTDSKIPSYSTDKRDGSNVPKYSTKMNGKNKEVSRYSTPSSKRDIPSYSTSKPPSDPVEKRRPRPDQAAPSKRKDSSDRNGQKLSLRGQHPPSGRDLPKHPSSMARKERPPSPGSRFRMPQKTLNRSNRIESDSDEEYDDEMADFIDDGRQDDDMDYSSHIREIFGYDKSRYLYEDYEDEEVMEASFAEQMKEEGRSARIGLMEDLEDIRREEEEL